MPRIPPDQRSPHDAAATATAEKKRSKAPSHDPRRHGDRGDPDALDVWLSFDDLKRAGLIKSWKVLREWQKDKRIGFPLGKLLAPNTRRWSKQHDIDPWLASRPVERDGFGDAERKQDAEGDDAKRAEAQP